MQHIRVRTSSASITNKYQKTTQPSYPCKDCENHNGIFIPQWLLERTDVTITEKIIWAELTKYCNKNQECHPSQETIAKEVSLSRKTVNEGINNLCQLKLITKTPPQGKEKLQHWNCRYKLQTLCTIIKDEKGSLCVEEPQKPKEIPNKTKSIERRLSDNSRRSKSTYIYHFHELTGCWPNKVQEEEINTIVNDIIKWEKVLKAWLMKGYSPVGVAGMLDWYANGIPKAFNNTAFKKETVRENFASRRDPNEKYKNIKTTVINSENKT